MDGIQIDKQQKDIKVEHQVEINAESKNLNVYSRYHDSEINQNQKILDSAIKITWSGFCILLACIIFAFFDKIYAATLSGVSGVLLEAISGTIYVLVDKSSKSKYQYFEKLSEDETEKNIFHMVEMVEDESYKCKLIEMMVYSWCNKKKK